MKAVRFWAVAFLLAIPTGVLRIGGDHEVIPAHRKLSDFPYSVAGWDGTDEGIDQETTAVLGQGEFLSRTYHLQGEEAPVQLFMAYFPTQKTGSTIHSPRHCLPGAGWSFESSTYVHLNDSKQLPHQVGEYVISNGDARAFVIYWYQAHGRSVANEYRARMYMVLDAIRLHRSDGALVRVVTPISRQESTDSARVRAESLASGLAAQISPYVPD